MRRVWELLGYLFFAGAVAFMLWGNTPRLVTDVLHRDEFVPASTAEPTTIRCKVWGMVFFNQCTLSYRLRGDAKEHSVEDWRFGSAPDGPYGLLQLHSDPTKVTSDVSLATLWNRMAHMLFSVGFGLGMLWMAVRRVMRRNTPV